MCSSCDAHPACSPYELLETSIGLIRGWGQSTEPLSASQATKWAEHGSKEWGTIFDKALHASTSFSLAAEILPTPSVVPEFNVFLEGKIDGATLKGSGTALWHIHMSLAGLVDSNATTSSEYVLGFTTITSVSLGNNYPIHTESVSADVNSAAHHDTGLSSPSIPGPSPVENVTCHDSNYLAAFTLAWNYVLSAYWSDVQKGVMRYTNCKACHASSTATASTTSLGVEVLFLDASHFSAVEVEWWRSILAPGKGWEATIDRYGQSWSSPWCLENENRNNQFIVVWEGSIESTDQPPTFKDSLTMLRHFAESHGILRQASMALLAALGIPTHNIWGIPVRLPPPTHRLPDRVIQEPAVDISTFQRLVGLLPRLVTISLFGIDGLLRSVFYDDSIHSLSSGQWIQPAVISWPDSSALAAEVGCQRCPQLARWWIGMAISGLLSKKTIKMLAGTGMWPTNLVASLWTAAKDSYFCSVFEQDIALHLSGNGPFRTIPRAEEVLMLFVTSGRGPEGRLVEATSCPWKPPGDILFDKTSSKVLLIGNTGATGRLVYNTWTWGHQPYTMHPPAKLVSGSDSFDEMAEKSGAATRAVLGWLETARGPDADLNVEFHALQRQIQAVEIDSQVGGSEQLSLSSSDIGNSPLPDIFEKPRAALGVFGSIHFDDAEAMVPWSTISVVPAKGTRWKMPPINSYGWCGLDAINAGLMELELSPIAQPEALEILSKTEDEVMREGMCVTELERLLNTRDRSVAIVDAQSGKRLRLMMARYKDSVINVGVDLPPHFIALSQVLAKEEV